MEARKLLQVSAIENGTVIDHIPTEAVFSVIKFLGLDACTSPITFGTNLDSKKFGKKGIIKVSNRYFEDDEINKIALVAPSASLIEIKDFMVIAKKTVQIPDVIEGFVKCFNPKCITNHQKVPRKFYVTDKENLKLKCHYCEKFTKKENIIIL
ncbi:MAG: aspartate carbamoyltransferase regulatory subunit [Bacteroidales bacterium]|nr:aspartate carbamoyltransferase regulatory subunit [Bacteroidales bacterium]MDD3962101.1 aspartate carbamoyltransferase regulatory subunit [Bacteroidales bacterium]HPE87474.1 aspartate carbamoyltransferase regulatory subunit [Bacteroidales bacterium]